MRVLLLISIALFAGCGQSGGLYLPPKERPAPPAETPPIATPAPEQQQQEKDKK